MDEELRALGDLFPYVREGTPDFDVLRNLSQCLARVAPTNHLAADCAAKLMQTLTAESRGLKRPGRIVLENDEPWIQPLDPDLQSFAYVDRFTEGDRTAFTVTVNRTLAFGYVTHCQRRRGEDFDEHVIAVAMGGKMGTVGLYHQRPGGPMRATVPSTLQGLTRVLHFRRRGPTTADLRVSRWTYVMATCDEGWPDEDAEGWHTLNVRLGPDGTVSRTLELAPTVQYGYLADAN